MKEIKTEIIIQANPDKIWKIFTDFQGFSEWNPFIRAVEGNVAVGNTISIQLTPPDASPMGFKPKVLKVEPNRELRWLGHLLIPGLFDGEHIFEFIDNKNGTTTFIQREVFNGILVGLFSKMLDDNTRRGFELMNRKLKEKCE